MQEKCAVCRAEIKPLSHIVYKGHYFCDSRCFRRLPLRIYSEVPTNRAVKTHETFGLDGWLTNTINRIAGWFRKDK